MKTWKLWIGVALCLPLAVGLAAQDTKKSEKQDTGKKMPEYQPTKEHMALKQFDGDWELKTKCMMPGQPVSEGQGTETCRLAYGGFWLSIEEKGMTMGKDFTGTGLIGWDPAKKKYVGVWADNMAPHLGRFEGEADSSGKVFTFKMIFDDPKMAKECPERMVFEFKDQDHRSAKFYGKDESGKETVWSEITYTRKPAMVK